MPPAVKVVTVPADPTVATLVLLDDHVPPATLLVKLLTSPAQMLVSPSISSGIALTVMFFVL